MTEDERAELEVAVAELAFWLDFAKWWRQKYCGEEAPRIKELLQHAEQRCQRAWAPLTAAGEDPPAVH